MSNTPQAQKPQAQNIPSSNQNQSKTAPAAGNVKKDEQAAGSMKDKGNSCATSDKKSKDAGCK